MSTFDHKIPTQENIWRIEAIRQAFRVLEMSLFGYEGEGDGREGLLKPCRPTSVCTTKLEEACMWAIKGVVFEDSK